MNPQLKQLFSSILITISISAIFALGAVLIFGGLSTFIGSFISVFAFQFFVSYLWNNLLILKRETADDDILKAFIEKNTKQQISVSCAFCRAKNIINININEENYFNCKHCNQNNVVLLEFSTARAGEEISVTNIENDIYDKIKNVQKPNPNTTKIKDLSEPIKFNG